MYNNDANDIKPIVIQCYSYTYYYNFDFLYIFYILLCSISRNILGKNVLLRKAMIEFQVNTFIIHAIYIFKNDIITILFDNSYLVFTGPR